MDDRIDRAFRIADSASTFERLGDLSAALELWHRLLHNIRKEEGGEGRAKARRIEHECGVRLGDVDAAEAKYGISRAHAVAEQLPRAQRDEEEYTHRGEGGEGGDS